MRCGSIRSWRSWNSPRAPGRFFRPGTTGCARAAPPRTPERPPVFGPLREPGPACRPRVLARAVSYQFAFKMVPVSRVPEEREARLEGHGRPSRPSRRPASQGSSGARRRACLECKLASERRFLFPLLAFLFFPDAEVRLRRGGDRVLHDGDVLVEKLLVALRVDDRLIDRLVAPDLRRLAQQRLEHVHEAAACGLKLDVVFFF